MGQPLKNSLSPFIHNSFAKQFAIPIDYQVIEVTAAKLMTTIDYFVTSGGAGINITAPYKELVFQQLQNHNPRALQARSLNTIVVKPDGSLWGDNTDGAGLVADFKRHNIPVTGHRILIFGAGGAARGILPALLTLHPKSVMLVNRDLIKATKIAADFIDYGDIRISSYDKLVLTQFDVIINATSNAELFSNFNIQDCHCYDLNYKQKVLAPGVVNGLGMLVEQAAIAFELWHGKTPAIEPVLQALQY